MDLLEVLMEGSTVEHQPDEETYESLTMATRLESDAILRKLNHTFFA